MISLIFIFSLTFLGWKATLSLWTVFVSLMIFLISLKLGFRIGQQKMFDSIYEMLDKKGYHIYVDDNDEFRIERKYGDHWYNNK
jgi:hypothetical protein